MMFGPGDDGSVFPKSAQDILNLVIDGHYILKIQKEIEHGSNLESCSSRGALQGRAPQD